MIENLEAIGIIDRDSKPEDFFNGLEAGITAIPFHEVEGILCIPELVVRIARHLGKTKGTEQVKSTIVAAVKTQLVIRTATERASTELVNQSQDHILSKPTSWTEAAVRNHVGRVDAGMAGLRTFADLFDQEQMELNQLLNAGSAEEILKVFPSKPIAAAVAKSLSMPIKDLSNLIRSALASVDSSDPLWALGQDLESILELVELPPRSVEERSLTVPPSS